jgi:ABC-type branched-subunit amino acid transport system substrate-binding protein
MQRRDVLKAGGAAAWLIGSGARAAEPGVTDKEVLLGHTGILTGPLGATIKTMLSGADLAFAEANAQGGVAGRRLRLSSLDDELKPEKAVANYDKLLNEQRVFGFFGCVGSATTAAAAKLLVQSGAPLVGAYAVADSARDKVRGAAYFVRATTGREAQALVQHLTTIGVTRIAVAHLDNPGGQEALALMQSALAAVQLQPQAAAAIRGDGSNAADAANALAAAQPQAVVMYLSGALPGELMKASFALGNHPMFYGMSIVTGDATIKVIGEKARGLAISQVVPYPWADSEPVARDYRRLSEAAQVPVGYYSYEGYLSALVTIEALKRCGRELTRARFHDTLRSFKLRLAGMDVDFSGGSHNGSRFVELVQVSQGGRYVR